MADPGWTADECAQAWGVAASTWRDAVADGRAPAPLPGFDEQRRRRWDPGAVTGWARPGQGARTDLGPVSGTDAEVAALLVDLVALAGPVVDRATIREAWLGTYPEDGGTHRSADGVVRRRTARRAPRRDGRPHTTGTTARRRVGQALSRLESLGALVRRGDVVEVLDAALLERIAGP